MKQKKNETGRAGCQITPLANRSLFSYDQPAGTVTRPRQVSRHYLATPSTWIAFSRSVRLAGSELRLRSMIRPAFPSAPGAPANPERPEGPAGPASVPPQVAVPGAPSPPLPPDPPVPAEPAPPA